MLSRDKWLDTEIFSELYDVNTDYIAVYAHKNRGNGFAKKIGNKNYINASKLERIKKHRVNMWNKSHENYYEIKLERGITDAEHVRLLVASDPENRSQDSWNSFIYYNLFREIHDVSILNTGISPMLIAYYEWSEEFLHEPTVSDFRSVDEYFHYWEARKIKEEMIA